MTDYKKDILLLGLFSFALFIIGNGSIPATDPVESNYVLTAKEMLLSGDFISPRIYGNYWYDKPAFFYWELIGAFLLFGISDFAARFFPTIFGVIGVLMTYFFARKIYDRKTALVSGLLLSTSFGYWLISKTIITDMTLFVFFNAVLVFFYIAYCGKNKNWYYPCYLFSGLAVLTKGPIGILLPGLIVTLFIIARRDWREIPRMRPLGFVIFAAVVASWYLPMYRLHGSEFLDTFLGVHNVLRATQSEHPMWDVWWYYSVLFFIMFFPWSFLTLPQAIRKYIKNYRATRDLPKFDATKIFLLIWAITINLFYQQMATKYSTYTLPSMLPIVILASRFLIERGAEKLIKRVAIVWSVIIVLLTFLVAVPETRHGGSSYSDVAAYLKETAGEDDLVVLYGVYKASLPYYSGLTVCKLETKENVAALRPDGKSWNSLNVMPFYAAEELPSDKNIYLVLQKKGEKLNSEKPVVDLSEYELIKTFKDCKIYKKEKK